MNEGRLSTRSTVLAGAVLAAMTACASSGGQGSGLLSPEQAARYSALAPFEFVRLRFYDEARTGVMDAVESAVKGYADAINRLQRRPPLEASKSVRKPELAAEASMVTWPAYFTDSNYVLLVRPAAELKRFCEAKGGQWRSLERHSDDPLAALRANPIAVFLDAHARATRYLVARGSFSGYEELREVVATDVGAEMAEEAASSNRRVDRLFSAEGFRYAQRLDAFGLFSCEQPRSGSWWVSVLPATLISRDPSNAPDSSMVRIAIRVYATKPKGQS